MDDVAVTDKPTPRVYFEKIGSTEWELREETLDVHEEVSLWPENPRLQIHVPVAGVHSEEELETALQNTGGYDTLRKSIDDLGQMEPINVWRPNDTGKYLVK